MKKYFTVWWISSKGASQVALSDRVGAIFLVAGKIIRFLFFFLFLFIISTKTKALSGYTTNQVIFFFLTFNFVDILAQMLFREVYRFRPQIVSGSFDLILSRPVSPLFRSLLGGTDILDFITLPPLIILMFIFAVQIHPAFLSIFSYILLILNGLVIATAFHIAVLSLGVVTTAIDHTIMIYRDLVGMGRIPIDFYKEPLRAVLTFAVPVGIMMSLPAKVLMGIFEWQIILYSFIFSIITFLLSLQFWRWALKNYSSAST